MDNIKYINNQVIKNTYIEHYTYIELLKSKIG